MKKIFIIATIALSIPTFAQNIEVKKSSALSKVEEVKGENFEEFIKKFDDLELSQDQKDKIKARFEKKLSSKAAKQEENSKLTELKDKLEAKNIKHKEKKEKKKIKLDKNTKDLKEKAKVRKENVDVKKQELKAKRDSKFEEVSSLDVADKKAKTEEFYKKVEDKVSEDYKDILTEDQLKKLKEKFLKKKN